MLCQNIHEMTTVTPVDAVESVGLAQWIENFYGKDVQYIIIASLCSRGLTYFRTRNLFFFLPPPLSGMPPGLSPFYC